MGKYTNLYKSCNFLPINLACTNKKMVKYNHRINLRQHRDDDL